MVKDLEKLKLMMMMRARQLAGSCKNVFFALSGGIDSSLIGAILSLEFGPEKVFGMHRKIKSNPKHLEDAKLLQSVFKFKLIELDLNDEYDSGINKVKREFERLGLPWADEGTREADDLGFTSGYASLKSCLTTPWAAFISKIIDNGFGRIYGTGNGEEDGILRYFDKRGDGAVDNNLLNGLTKAEVRQLAIYLGVPMRIVTKLPSADLEASGDKHNDEDQLTGWAKKLGFPNLKISYGAPDGSSEGNIAWAWKEDIKHGVITGYSEQGVGPMLYNREQLSALFNYKEDEIDVILFLREVERTTRHKVEPIPGLERYILQEAGAVD